MRLAHLPAVAAAAGLLLCAGQARAQSPPAKPKTAAEGASVGDKTGDKAAAAAEAERAREARRELARSLLFSLSGEARNFRDQKLRARSLARIADALWVVAAEQGRVLFREAWDAAGKAGRENEQAPDLRRDVLALAARRDRLLAEEFLLKLKAERAEAEASASGNDASAQNNQWALPEAAEKRLRLAKDMLDAGDVERALQFADPVLGAVTLSTVEFLTQLRDKDPAAADRRYAAMLSGAASDPLADANTVSLLSTYLFTPHLYVIFNREGGAETSSWGAVSPPPKVEPRLRLAFFRAAGAVLLRPQPPPEQDRSSAGLVGRYLILKRLLPLFEQHAPQELAQAVRGQFEALDSQMSDGARRGDDEWVKKGIEPEPADRQQPLLEAVERARTSEERDELYFQMALLALDSDEAKAREYVGKIDSPAFRGRVQAWVDWALAHKAVERGKVEAALELARGGELTRIQRVWLLARAARLLAKADRDRAQALVDEAKAEARRIERLDPDRPRGLLAVANAQRAVEPSRAWDALADVVEAANSAEGFTGEDGLLVSNVNSKSRIMKKTDSAPEFNIEGVFGEAAGSDLERAVQLARGFKGEAPRTNALIAVARAVLGEKSAHRTEPRD